MNVRPEKEAIRRVLPRGINAASREVVRSSQRERLLEAMIELAARKGFQAVTIAEIVGRAGVAKPTFYEHFDDKEHCFLEAFDASVKQAIAALWAAISPKATAEERVVSGLDAFLRFIAADDNRARVILIEPLKAGDKATAHMTEAHQMFASAYIQSHEEIRRNQPESGPMSETRALAIVGAVNEPICAALRRGNSQAVLELADELHALVGALAFARP